MATELTYDLVRGYLDSLVPPRPDEMRAIEAYADEVGFPIVGPASGYLCYLIARLITTDPAWIASIVPIRDGLLLAFKK